MREQYRHVSSPAWTRRDQGECLRGRAKRRIEARSANAGQPDGRRRLHTRPRQVFDPRKNALNSWRLALATLVIVFHSFPLTGRDVPFAPARQLLREIGVDGFFAISGFLIVASWLGTRGFATISARGFRILPGFYTCLIVTAFVIAPIGVALQGGRRATRSHVPIEYILKNSAVWMFQFDVGGTPHGIPWTAAWNFSLWTLKWELLCYIAVAVLGVVGLLRRRWLLPAAMVLALSWAALVSYTTSYSGLGRGLGSS